MNTTKRVENLAALHNISVFELAKRCDVPYTTIQSTLQRGGQLGIDTIERICIGLNMQLYEFFIDEAS